jgi:hypothetical protein
VGGHKALPYDASMRVNTNYVAAGFIPASEVGTPSGGHKALPYDATQAGHGQDIAYILDVVAGFIPAYTGLGRLGRYETRPFVQNYEGGSFSLPPCFSLATEHKSYVTVAAVTR